MTKRSFKSQKSIVIALTILTCLSPLRAAFANSYYSADGLISKEFLSQNDTRTIGESLANHVYAANDQVPAYNEIKYDFIKDSELLIIFRSEHLKSIIQSGFLNIHDTMVSSLGYPLFLEELPEHRAKHEDALIQLKIEHHYKLKAGNPNNKIRPKYALLQLTASVEVGKWLTTGAMYGDLIAVLKPETKRRATWTIADSLANKILRPRSFYRKSIEAQSLQKNKNYLEAQIWGEVDIKDISHFLVNPQVLNTSTFELLKSTGLPIYDYYQVEEHSRTIFKKNRLLYKGDIFKIVRLQEQLIQSWSSLRKTVRLKCQTLFTN